MLKILTNQSLIMKRSNTNDSANATMRSHKKAKLENTFDDVVLPIELIDYILYSFLNEPSPSMLICKRYYEYYKKIIKKKIQTIGEYYYQHMTNTNERELFMTHGKTAEKVKKIFGTMGVGYFLKMDKLLEFDTYEIKTFCTISILNNNARILNRVISSQCDVQKVFFLEFFILRCIANGKYELLLDFLQQYHEKEDYLYKKNCIIRNHSILKTFLTTVAQVGEDELIYYTIGKDNRIHCPYIKTQEYTLESTMNLEIELPIYDVWSVYRGKLPVIDERVAKFKFKHFCTGDCESINHMHYRHNVYKFLIYLKVIEYVQHYPKRLYQNLRDQILRGALMPLDGPNNLDFDSLKRALDENCLIVNNQRINAVLV